MSDRSFASFISFEGIDGCGKSTLLAHSSAWLSQRHIEHLVTREPGGTRLGESLREILLDTSFSSMDPWAEILLYAASRAQHVREVIKPALERGLWVLSDRFVDATLAYQGYGRGLDTARLKRIHEWTSGGLWPGLTVLLDCDIKTAIKRRKNRSGGSDRLELQDEAFHERVRAGYLELSKADPDRFIVLDAGRSLDRVLEDFRNLFSRRFNAG